MRKWIKRIWFSCIAFVPAILSTIHLSYNYVVGLILNKWDIWSWLFLIISPISLCVLLIMSWIMWIIGSIQGDYDDYSW